MEENVHTAHGRNVHNCKNHPINQTPTKRNSAKKQVTEDDKCHELYILLKIIHKCFIKTFVHIIKNNFINNISGKFRKQL